MIILALIIVFSFSLAVCWFVCAISFGVAKYLKKPEIARLAGKILVCLSGIAFPTGLLLRLLFAPSATFVYQGEFHEKPSPDIKNLLGYRTPATDSQVSCLRFQASPSTIERLAKIQKLKPVEFDKFDDYSFNGSDKPDWWHPKVTSRSRIYSVEREDGSFSHESVALVYEPQTQIAHYSFVGID